MRWRISNGAVLFTLGLTLAFWYVIFHLQWFNFWLSISVGIATLSLLAFYFGGWPFQRYEFDLRVVFFGVLSAVVLYFIFWAGNVLAQWLFTFAKPQLESLYYIRYQGNAFVIPLILLFITSPGEEIFWRGFIQRWAMNRWGETVGWIASALFYAGVHIFSGNYMLVMAALVGGLFWGYIYRMENSLVPGIISHAVWAVGIFCIISVL